MSAIQQRIAYVVLGILLIVFCTWGWFQFMEKRWGADLHVSAAAQENPMLAATQLLNQHRQTVRTEILFSEILRKPLPGGTLILAENNGIITPLQAQQLLLWVRQGNTLITRPRWQKGNETSTKNKTVVDAADPDPIGTHLGVMLAPRVITKAPAPPQQADIAPPVPAPPRTVNFKFPTMTYPLQVESYFYHLQTTQAGALPVLSDETNASVRIYAEGKGRIVVLAENYFNNYNLRRYDHAELLLQLVELNPVPYIAIVQHTDVPKWYRALWLNFQAGIIGLGCLLLLLLWRAIQRFGPLLPEPGHERRSLIEHIDASGRWLWKVPGGRDLLLTAARASTNKILQRRAPELQRLSMEQQIVQLAQRCGLTPAALNSALRQPAAKIPPVFTQQIKTLQLLRKYYER